MRTSRGTVPPPLPPGSEPLWEEALGQCPALVMQERPPTLPLPCFLLQSPMPWGQLEQVVMTGRERKAGGRKGGPGERQNPLQENVLADTSPDRTTRQRHKSVLLSIKRLATFVWDEDI